MSYSDYGAYCWKNGLRFLEAEDSTLIGINAPKERPLERVTGLKLDVLINAYARQGELYGTEEAEERINWLLGHPHHLVIGSLEGLALIGHKQTIEVLWNGESVRKFPDYDKYPEDPEKEFMKTRTMYGEQEGFRYWGTQVKFLPFEKTRGVMVKLVTPNSDEYLGVTGYGIGNHWWIKENGTDKDGAYWPTFEEWEELIKKERWINENNEEELVLA